MKRYVVIGGVNGAGKTTFYSVENTFDKLEKINLDETVRSIGNWKNKSDVIKAGKIVVKRIEQFFKEGVSFCQETTLCGQSIINNINKAKKLGYKVDLCYVGLENADIAKSRVKNRVLNGGHGVSDEDIDRRYKESLQNLKKILPICDTVTLYDNSEKLTRLAFYENGKCIWNVKNMPQWYKVSLMDQ